MSSHQTSTHVSPLRLVTRTIYVVIMRTLVCLWRTAIGTMAKVDQYVNMG